MIHARVHLEDGDSFVTGFNGTEADVIAYYVGNLFNFGPRWVNGVEQEDYMVRAVRVEFLPS